VCRLFEATTYAAATAACLSIGGASDALPMSAPPGFMAREIERAALSFRLMRIELFLPPSVTAASTASDLAALAASLPSALPCNTSGST